MKRETLLTKEELHELLLQHIIDNDLTEVDSVSIENFDVTVSLDDIVLKSEEMVELIAKATDTPPDSNKLVVTPDGGIGLEEEIILRT